MTRWLFTLLLGAWIVSAPVSLAQDSLRTVPPCKGIGRGYVTVKITPDGSIVYYLADRPMTHIQNVKNLTCWFPLTGKVQLIEETPL